MKFYLLSDNVDTLTGMAIVGIQGEVIHERMNLLIRLEELMKDKDLAIILITTKLIELCPEVIFDIKLKQREPLLVEIPDRHGQSKIGETIDAYVSKAIGMKL